MSIWFRVAEWSLILFAVCLLWFALRLIFGRGEPRYVRPIYRTNSEEKRVLVRVEGAQRPEGPWRVLPREEWDDALLNALVEESKSRKEA